MAKELDTNLRLVASDSVILLMGALVLVAVIIIYTLILFVRNRHSPSECQGLETRSKGKESLNNRNHDDDDISNGMISNFSKQTNLCHSCRHKQQQQQQQQPSTNLNCSIIYQKLFPSQLDEQNEQQLKVDYDTKTTNSHHGNNHKLEPHERGTKSRCSNCNGSIHFPPTKLEAEAVEPTGRNANAAQAKGKKEKWRSQRLEGFYGKDPISSELPVRKLPQPEVGDQNRWLVTTRKLVHARRLVDSLWGVQASAGRFVGRLAIVGDPMLTCCQHETLCLDSELLNSRQIRALTIQIPANEHPIIFGKSKDSILVPDFMSFCGDSASMGSQLPSAYQGQELSLQPAAEPPPATTHILTDERGHSIKIRIASPPPQRQTQLAKLYQEQLKQKQQQQQQLLIPGLTTPRHRDSLASVQSDSPLMEAAESRRSSGVGAASESPMARRKRSPTPKLRKLGPSEALTATDMLDALQKVGPLERDAQERSGQPDRWVKFDSGPSASNSTSGESWASGRDLEADASDAATSPPGVRVKSPTAISRPGVGGAGEQQAPIGNAPSNSNSSEFEEPPWADSRQDTSLDLNRAQAYECQQTNELANNESVLDADIRQASRLNMELLMLQNAANQVGVSISGASAPALGRSNRSKSLTGAASGGFPQCGILPAASEFCSIARQFQQAAQMTGSNERLPSSKPLSPLMVKRQRRAASSDLEFGMASLPMESSRRSSLTQSLPSLRIAIRLLAAEQDTQTLPSSRLSGLFGQLASIGRLSSRGSSQDSASGLDSLSGWQGEPLYEVRLLEARNVIRGPARHQQPSGPAPLGHTQSAPGGSESRGRRESLLGSLVAASQPARRHSLEGLVVRVFKQRAGGRSDSSDAGQDPRLPATNPAAADYIQLPLVKVSAFSERVPFCPLDEGADQSQDAGPQSFVCRQSEFPVRISLYQVSRRGGARCTLGHCFVSPDDWMPSVSQSSCELSAAEQPSGEPAPKTRQLSESSSSGFDSDLSDQLARCKFIVLGSSLLSGRNEPQQAQLEYRLYQTILEAMR